MNALNEFATKLYRLLLLRPLSDLHTVLTPAPPPLSLSRFACDGCGVFLLITMTLRPYSYPTTTAGKPTPCFLFPLLFYFNLKYPSLGNLNSRFQTASREILLSPHGLMPFIHLTYPPMNISFHIHLSRTLN